MTSAIVTDFLSIQERLENLTDTDYQKHISGLVAARLAKPKKMKARHNRYWNEIATENYVFNREDIETAHVKTITQQQLVSFFKVNAFTNWKYIFLLTAIVNTTR